MKRRKGFNYLRYPGLTPDKMNWVQFKAWDDYIDYLATNLPSESLANKLHVNYYKLIKSNKFKYANH